MKRESKLLIVQTHSTSKLDGKDSVLHSGEFGHGVWLDLAVSPLLEKDFSDEKSSDSEEIMSKNDSNDENIPEFKTLCIELTISPICIDPESLSHFLRSSCSLCNFSESKGDHIGVNPSTGFEANEILFCFPLFTPVQAISSFPVSSSLYGSISALWWSLFCLDLSIPSKPHSPCLMTEICVEDVWDGAIDGSIPSEDICEFIPAGTECLSPCSIVIPSICLSDLPGWGCRDGIEWFGQKIVEHIVKATLMMADLKDCHEYDGDSLQPDCYHEPKIMTSASSSSCCLLTSAASLLSPTSHLHGPKTLSSRHSQQSKATLFTDRKGGNINRSRSNSCRNILFSIFGTEKVYCEPIGRDEEERIQKARLLSKLAQDQMIERDLESREKRKAEEEDIMFLDSAERIHHLIDHDLRDSQCLSSQCLSSDAVKGTQEKEYICDHNGINASSRSCSASFLPWVAKKKRRQEERAKEEERKRRREIYKTRGAQGQKMSKLSKNDSSKVSKKRKVKGKEEEEDLSTSSKASSSVIAFISSFMTNQSNEVLGHEADNQTKRKKKKKKRRRKKEEKEKDEEEEEEEKKKAVGVGSREHSGCLESVDMKNHNSLYTDSALNDEVEVGKKVTLKKKRRKKHKEKEKESVRKDDDSLEGKEEEK
ncbi:hypothetical protein ADUPG1_014004, partial [Aduncisulcus paluster]